MHERFDFQAAYDELNAGDHDYRFYAALAREVGAQRVLDLGCGTGTLARMLAADGCQVVAIDPDPEMLRVARAKPGAPGVDWRLGYADSADPDSVDLVLMTGHVAQVFVTEESWSQVLRAVHRALRPEGGLAFETRNPGARAWERWTRADTVRTVHTEEGPVEFWHETVDVALPEVTYDSIARALADGHESRDRNVLAFREPEALRASLHDAGFSVLGWYGDWERRPVTDSCPELIVVARRSPGPRG